jgi:GTPase SAR1 family protein
VDNLNIGELVRKAVEEAFRERGHANVLIAGRTRVGKSTLINSIFQGNFATTGQGRPVTQNTREITKDGIPLSIFDTRGLEMADFSSAMKSLRSFIAERHGDRDQKKHIHVAWVCIAEDLRFRSLTLHSLFRFKSGWLPESRPPTGCPSRMAS